jgi:hypothetical protein
MLRCALRATRIPSKAPRIEDMPALTTLHHGCRLSNTAFPLYGIIGSTSRRLDGAAGMMLVRTQGPCRKTGGSRQGRACHPFRDGRDVEHVRQTLSDVRAPIGDVEWGFPDRP